MNSDEVIRHFEDMGVLRDVANGPNGKPFVIMASAPEGYAQRCMNDLKASDTYFEGKFRIDADTTDGVMVAMYKTEES